MNLHNYLTTTALIFIACICDGEKFVKVARLSDLSPDQHQDIFTTTYHDNSGKSASHDIKLFDELGKYIRLSYQSKHGSSTNILKVDEAQHANNIESLLCSLDDQQNELITLHIKSSSIAQQYYNRIKSSISHSQKKHFIAAGHKWRCNQAILKEITQIDLHDTSLILYTSHATLTDIFEELSLSYETNTNHPYSISNVHHADRRRLKSSFMAGVWSNAIHGLSSVFRFIRGIIHSLNVPMIQKIATGESIQVGPKNMTKTWGWNYEGEDVKKHINISENVTCALCSAHLDVVYKYQLKIAQYTLQYLRVSLEGNASIKAGIRVKSGYRNKLEYRQNTEKFALSAFAVAGIVFEADIYGQMGIGVYGDIDEISIDIGVTGYIEKGIEYNRSAQNQYNYINEHSFDFNKTYPHAGLQQGQTTAYVRPTLYLQLMHLGSLFFGFQPSFTFKFAIKTSEKCVVHYIPSTKINEFIGADLSAYILDWRKTVNFAQFQTNLDNWAGCMDNHQLIKSQIWLPSLYLIGEIYEKNEIPNIGEAVIITYKDQIHEIPTIEEAVTYVNYSNEHLIPRFSENELFSEYWGNLSTVPVICNNYSEICEGYITQAIVPHIGQLMISTQNGTLYGMYHTIIEISPANNWPFLHNHIVTNVSCLARHQFDIIDHASEPRMHTYKVTLLEWYCDTDLIYFGINKTANPQDYAGWKCMISLPSIMHSMATDASFSSMLLFDAGNWCYVFPLSTKQQYMLDAVSTETQLNWTTIYYPTYPLWYGVWDCNHLLIMNQTQKNSKLYFVSYNENTTKIEVIMQLDEDSTIYLEGELDFAELILELDAIYWYEEAKYFEEIGVSLHFHGFLRILSDGSIIYAGSIDHEDCTGFLFHGYTNLAQLNDDELIVDDNSKEPHVIHNETNDSFVSSKSVIVFFIGMTSAFVIIAVVALCLRCRIQKKRLHQYRLMNDDKL